jgi:hypothetical protein
MMGGIERENCSGSMMYGYVEAKIPISAEIREVKNPNKCKIWLDYFLNKCYRMPAGHKEKGQGSRS